VAYGIDCTDNAIVDASQLAVSGRSPEPVLLLVLWWYLLQLEVLDKNASNQLYQLGAR